jgi:hypothetical protein
VNQQLATQPGTTSVKATLEQLLQLQQLLMARERKKSAKQQAADAALTEKADAKCEQEAGGEERRNTPEKQPQKVRNVAKMALPTSMVPGDMSRQGLRQDRPTNIVGHNWAAQLARLVAYKAEHGDCTVPLRWAEDPRLGQWVGDQRKGKKALDRGDPGPWG